MKIKFLVFIGVLAIVVFCFGAATPASAVTAGANGFIPITGDWNGDCAVTGGLYDPITSTFFLSDSSNPGTANITFTFGTPNAGWIPITGDWNKDGKDTVGLYNPANSTFYLKNSNTAGSPDITFSFGGNNSQPFAGNWSATKVSCGVGRTRYPNVSVGTMFTSGSSNIFMIRKALSAGPADYQMTWSLSGAPAYPVIGDWNNDGTDGIGLFVPAGINGNVNNTFYESDTLNGVPVMHATFNFQNSAIPANAYPVAGDWNADGLETIGIYDQIHNQFLLSNSANGSTVDYTTTIYLPALSSYHITASAGAGGTISPSGVVTVASGASQTFAIMPSKGYAVSNVLTNNGLSSAGAVSTYTFTNVSYSDTISASFKASACNWKAISGDWNGDRQDSVGVYDPVTSTFYLKNSNTGGYSDISFGFGAPNAGWLPIAGDWNGDSITTVGLYDPKTSTFYLRNSNSAGPADITFGFGAANSGWLPIVGDWNGVGTDKIGLYDPSTSTFYLRGSNTSGAANLTFGFGAANAGWLPFAGDWNNDGLTTIGLYDPQSSTFYLKNTNSGGNADIMFGFGPSGGTYSPLAGDWDKQNGQSVGIYSPVGSNFYLTNSNSAGYASAQFGFGAGTCN